MHKIGSLEYEMERVARMIISTFDVMELNEPYCNVNKLSHMIHSIFHYEMAPIHYTLVEREYPDMFKFDLANEHFYIIKEFIPMDLF